MGKVQVVEHTCDVLMVGGGLAGCMGAIRAGELNDRVILVDKSNPARSGCAATGVDHLWAYFPEVQQAEGVSVEDLVDNIVENIGKGLANREVVQYVVETSLDRILDLERFGMKVRYEDSTLPGNFRLQYQLHPCRNTLHFDGRDIKKVLAREVKKRGVEIVDRVMVTDLLTEDGQAAGAVGYGTRDGCVHVFRAKAVVMSTGRMNRLYKTPVGEVFSTRMPPALTGDGKAAMFRAGAEIVNAEFSVSVGRWTSRNFVRGGGIPGNSYQPPGIGVNAHGQTIQPRYHDFAKYGLPEWKGVGMRGRAQRKIGRTFGSEMEAGRAPLYADMSWGTEEDQAYMRWGISNEGGGWALNHILDVYGLDYRTTKIELAPTEPEISGLAACGPLVDGNLQTSVPGLFAAGDEAGGVSYNAAPGALTMGYLAAEKAVEHASKMEHVPHGEGEEAVVSFCQEIVDRGEDGDPWQDAQAFIQNTMSYYNHTIKSETMAKRALEYMDYLRNRMALKAANPHEMTHCLEVRNLIECGEMVLRGTLEREESRYFLLQRVDYPERDDESFHCWLAQRKEGDGVVFERRYPES